MAAQGSADGRAASVTPVVGLNNRFHHAGLGFRHKTNLALRRIFSLAEVQGFATREFRRQRSNQPPPRIPPPFCVHLRSSAVLLANEEQNTKNEERRTAERSAAVHSLNPSRLRVRLI